MQQGLKQVKSLTGLHGRWEILHENPAIVSDVGHNEDGMKAIANQIRKYLARRTAYYFWHGKR